MGSKHGRWCLPLPVFDHERIYYTYMDSEDTAIDHIGATLGYLQDT